MMLGPDDLWLFNEGAHTRLYEHLGAHPGVDDGGVGSAWRSSRSSGASSRMAPCCRVRFTSSRGSSSAMRAARSPTTARIEPSAADGPFSAACKQNSQRAGGSKRSRGKACEHPTNEAYELYAAVRRGERESWRVSTGCSIS